MSVDDLIYPDGTKPKKASAPLDDADMEELAKSLDERSAIITDIIQNLDKMNDAGKQKVVEYVRDLIKISEYKKN
jgi:hypothetical protein